MKLKITRNERKNRGVQVYIASVHPVHSRYECFCLFMKPTYNSDFSQVMDTFQENLIKNNFELIATELFNDDPKLQIENLKVSIQTQRLIFANRVKFILDMVYFYMFS